MPTNGPFDCFPLSATDFAHMTTLGESTVPFSTDECRCPACVAKGLPYYESPPLAQCCNKTVLMRCKGCPHVATPSYEQQGTGYDSGASGHELAGRRRAPAPRRTVIAFTGLAGSGKSTAAARLVERHGFARVRFAGPLKAMMAALGLTSNQIEGTEKEQPCALLGGRTPRYAMQTIGTEWGRDIIDRDLWIRAWRAAVDNLPAGQPIVVDDCRFPNEAEAVRAVGGDLVRIVRPGAGAGAAGHSSEEQALGASLWTIVNNGSIAGLDQQIDALIRNLSWADAANDARPRES